jgi:hypothetical protein
MADNTPQLTTTNAPSFEDVISAWDEPLRCQSVYNCRRHATWLAIHHKPCGGQQLICTFHYRKFMQEAALAIAPTGLMECHKCRTKFSTAEQCTAFRPL